MTTIAVKTVMKFEGTLTLDESEMRALEAMVGYGVEPFLKVFYDKLGKHYMRDHEQGLRSLFKAIKRDIPNHLHNIDEVRAAVKARKL